MISNVQLPILVIGSHYIKVLQPSIFKWEATFSLCIEKSLAARSHGGMVAFIHRHSYSGMGLFYGAHRSTGGLPHTPVSKDQISSFFSSSFSFLLCSYYWIKIINLPNMGEILFVNSIMRLFLSKGQVGFSLKSSRFIKNVL